MSLIQATFLGTGTSQGVPVIACTCDICSSDNPKDQRTRTSLLLTINNRNLVIDTGPDFRQQMLREKVMHLDAVLFTHEHKDHISGLDDIRAYNYHSGQAMKVFSTPNVFKALQREFHYIFDGTNYPGIPQVEMEFFNENEIQFEGESILPIEVMHYKLPVKAFRIRDFAYITDANYIAPTEMDKLRNLDILVVNALRREPHISHFTLQEALDLARELKPRKTYLTHISHLLGLHHEVSKELPAGVELAYDGLRIDIA